MNKEAKLLATAQSFTASWVDLGEEIGSLGWENLTIWLDLTLNNSTTMQIRFIHLHTAGGSEYDHVNESEASGTTRTYVQHYELEDADQKIVLDHHMFNTANFCKLQIKVATVGTPTAAIVNTAHYSLG